MLLIPSGARVTATIGLGIRSCCGTLVCGGRTGATVGRISGRGRPATVLAAHQDDWQRQVGARVLLARCREESALRRGHAAAVLRDLEPPLHRLGALEESLDFAELPAGERAHGRAEAVTPVHQLLDLAELEAGALGNADEPQLPQHLRVVAPLAPRAVGLGKQTDPFVVADRGRRN